MKNFEKNLKKQQERTKEMLREKLAKRKRHIEMRNIPEDIKLDEGKEREKLIEQITPLLQIQEESTIADEGDIISYFTYPNNIFAGRMKLLYRYSNILFIVAFALWVFDVSRVVFSCCFTLVASLFCFALLLLRTLRTFLAKFWVYSTCF